MQNRKLGANQLHRSPVKSSYQEFREAKGIFELNQPIILPATEKAQSDRFSISAIIDLMKFF